jgi:tetratricopeptide (TPR) repeat protein
LTEVVAALDEWASERRRQQMPAAEWQNLAELASALDRDADPRRREVRAILARGRLPLERALGVLGEALRPVPVPFDAGPGTDRGRLRQLAERTKAEAEPVLGLLTLTRALRVAGDDGIAERLLRTAVQARPGDVVLHTVLGNLLEEQQPPRWAEAVECYAAARALRPELGVSLAQSLIGNGRVREGLALFERLTAARADSPWLHISYGRALHDQGEFRKAAAAYRKAIDLNPMAAVPHNNLGIALAAKQDLEGAVAAYRKALALNPKLAQAHSNLGVALAAKRDLEGAVAAYRKAIDFDPKNGKSHSNLGNALAAQGDLEGAIAAHRKAIALDPKNPLSYYNLGVALDAKKDLEGAVAGYRKAIDLDPKHAPAHINLGSVLSDKKDLDGAITAYREAIRLDPNYATAHYNLGNVLREKGDLEGAVAAYRAAIILDPNDAKTHYNLGNALNGQRLFKDAEAAYGAALRLRPDLPEQHCNLGRVLVRQGRFSEALASLRRGHELGTKTPGWSYPSAEWVRQCEHLLALDEKLSAILKGEAQPADAAWRLALGQLCQQYKHRHAAAARFYYDAFEAEPKLANDLVKQYRYNAACSAALAAAGKGEDAKDLPNKVVVMLRRQALDWLRADLAAYTKLAESDKAATKQAVQQRLEHWQKDADLAGLRAPDALAQLPADEREACQQLWADVAALLQKVSAAK